IFAAGTGNPFFTTDTAAALRGSEVGAEIVIKATKVDGVYTADPQRDPRAERYTRLSFDEAIVKNLKVMDATALTLCRDQKLPINVFSIFKQGALKRVVLGEDEGTLVHVGFSGETAMALQIAELKKTTDQKMDKTIQAFKAYLAKVRTGRAHTGLLDHIQVDYYGSQMPLNQVAKVTLLDSRTIGVTPFEKKMTQAVEKAIRDSDLGLNPAASGETVRVPMPALTEERRKELIKVVR